MRAVCATQEDRGEGDGDTMLYLDQRQKKVFLFQTVSPFLSRTIKKHT